MSLCPTVLLCAYHACMRPYCKRSATLLSMHTFLQCPASSGQPSCPLPLVHDHSALPHAFNASCATQTVASAPPPPLPPRCGVASFQHAFFGRTARTHDRQACPWQYLCGFHVICQSTCCARSSEQGDGRCSGGGSGGGDAPAGQVRRRARPLPTSPGHELHSLPSSLVAWHVPQGGQQGAPPDVAPRQRRGDALQQPFLPVLVAKALANYAGAAADVCGRWV